MEFRKTIADMGKGFGIGELLRGGEGLPFLKSYVCRQDVRKRGEAGFPRRWTHGDCFDEVTDCLVFVQNPFGQQRREVIQEWHDEGLLGFEMWHEVIGPEGRERLGPSLGGFAGGVRPREFGGEVQPFEVLVRQWLEFG